MSLALYVFAGLAVFGVLVVVLLAVAARGEREERVELDVDDPAVVDQLLRDADAGPDFEARQSAVLVLGKSKDPRAVPKLIELLEPAEESEDPEGDDALRSMAVDALGETGDPAAVEPLVRVLHDSELYVEAARALARLPGSFAALLERLSMPRAENRMLGVRGLRAFPAARALGPLRSALRDRSQRVRREAADSYGCVLGQTVDEALLDEAALFLDDADDEVRAAILQGLAMRFSEGRLTIVRRALEDESVRVRTAAVLCLERFAWNASVQGSGEYHERFLRLVELALRDGDHRVRSRALVALHQDRSTAAGEMARRALRDDDSLVRSYAAWALRAQRYQPALTDLIDATKDIDHGVQKSSVEALGELGGVEAMEVLDRLVRDSETELDVRAQAVTAIGRIWSWDRKAPRTAVPMLMELLEHPQPRLRLAANAAVDHR